MPPPSPLPHTNTHPSTRWISYDRLMESHFLSEDVPVEGEAVHSAAAEHFSCSLSCHCAVQSPPPSITHPPLHQPAGGGGGSEGSPPVSHITLFSPTERNGSHVQRWISLKIKHVSSLCFNVFITINFSKMQQKDRRKYFMS